MQRLEMCMKRDYPLFGLRLYMTHCFKYAEMCCYKSKDKTRMLLLIARCVLI